MRRGEVSLARCTVRARCDSRGGGRGGPGREVPRPAVRAVEPVGALVSRVRCGCRVVSRNVRRGDCVSAPQNLNLSEHTFILHFGMAWPRPE